MKRNLLFALSLAALLTGTIARAEVGVSDKEIRIGSSGALTGSVAAYGQGMATGAAVLYDRVNKLGGVHGRRIKFTPMDDGYEPNNTLANVRKMVEQDRIFALVGGNGTPNMKAILPYITDHRIPVLFPLTGGLPDHPWIFNVRVSYSAEAESLIEFAVKELGIKEIGVFAQDDAFGTAGRAGVAKTLSKHGLSVKGDGLYKRNTVDVDAAVESLSKANPKAVYLQSVAKPAIAFIQKAAEKGFNPILLSSSVVGAGDMLAGLGRSANNIYVSEILPLPSDTSFAIVREFRDDMTAAGKEAQISSQTLEGYVGAAVFVEALKRMGKSPTREKLKATLESMKNVDIGGLKIGFSSTKRNGMDHNFIIRIKDGSASLVNVK